MEDCWYEYGFWYDDEIKLLNPVNDYTEIDKLNNLYESYTIYCKNVIEIIMLIIYECQQIGNTDIWQLIKYWLCASNLIDFDNHIDYNLLPQWLDLQ
jgi:hypothetical protein